jgi:hypothetical protein
MNDEQIKKIIDGMYEEPREDTIWSMVGDFYNRRMLSMVVLIWIWVLIFIAGAVYCAVQLLKKIEMKSQIMYAALFVCCWQLLGLMKIFAWQMIHRNSLKREIKRLELRIAELNETVKNK